MDLGISGLATGFDWRTLVDKLTAVEQQPEQHLRVEQNAIQQRKAAFAAISTQLASLQTRLTTLADPALYGSHSSAVSDATMATASATSAAASGAYAFHFSQLATSAQQLGTSEIGHPLSSSADVSGLTVSAAGFSTAVTAGTFTVNGKPVNLAKDDTLQGVFDKISAATSGTVTARYDPSTDHISLESLSPVILGSATDTSNFLAAAKLKNNGSNHIESTRSVGAARTGAPLVDANLSTAVLDGGAGTGEFKINGVSISFNSSQDSLQNILDRINSSSAGVTARYDTFNDQFTLSNQTTGDLGISLEDVSGNFLAATGLSGGGLQRGQDLTYTVNGGPERTSQSNTITDSGSGPAGLVVTALQEGVTATVTVAADTSKIRTAISDFVSEYNKTQSLLDSQTASTTDAKGKVTAGVLTGEGDAAQISRTLRSTAYGQFNGVLKGLADLGIETSGVDDSLTLGTSTKLDDSLANHLSDLKSLFSDPTSGLAVKLSAFIDKTIGDSGTLVTKQANLTTQSGGIDVHVADMERHVQENRQRLLESFVAMETAQAAITRQQQYLSKAFA